MVVAKPRFRKRSGISPRSERQKRIPAEQRSRRAAILYRPPTIGTVFLIRGRGVTRNGNFFNLYNHDFVRIAVGVPSVRVADPAYNADQTIALIREAADRKAVLALFPELGLSAYSCDDLFQQRALLDACLDALAAVVEATAKLSDRQRGRRAAPNRPSAIQLRDRDSSREDSRRRAEDQSPELPRILRAAAIHLGGCRHARRSRSCRESRASRSATT